jgi:hypothetical protein
MLGALLAGCAGYRGGWESVAYLGAAPPAIESRSSDQVRGAPELNVPGLTLRVTINNHVRTYDTQVYLYVLPLSVDPRSVHSGAIEPGKTRVYVNVKPRAAGFVFRPALATLHVGGARFSGSAGYEFGRWDAGGNRVERGGTWAHRPVTTDLTLAEVGRTYLLSIDFPAPLPSPEARDIALDLSRALSAPEQPPLPLIRFAPRRWKESYS